MGVVGSTPDPPMMDHAEVPQTSGRFMMAVGEGPSEMRKISSIRKTSSIGWWSSIPIGSMYGIYIYVIYANIGGILMVNVAVYGIHGSYGNVDHGWSTFRISSAPPSHFYGMDDHAANCVSEVLAAHRMVGQELSPVACPKSWWILSLWMVKKSCTKGWLKAYK